MLNNMAQIRGSPFGKLQHVAAVGLVALLIGGCGVPYKNLGERAGADPKTGEGGIIHPDEAVFHVPIHEGTQVLMVFEKNTDPSVLAAYAKETGKRYWGGDLCRIETRDLSQAEVNELKARSFGHILAGIRDGALAYWLLTDPELGTHVSQSQSQSQTTVGATGGGGFPAPR